jgi:hypothetical protein
LQTVLSLQRRFCLERRANLRELDTRSPRCSLMNAILQMSG